MKHDVAIDQDGVHIEITRELPSVTVRLSNGMRVTISDPGCGPSGFDGMPVIEVDDPGRDLLNGAESAPDTPRYEMAGEYLLGLPSACVIGTRCDNAQRGYGSGHATIDVEHRH
jgi:hypothetical protein